MNSDIYSFWLFDLHAPKIQTKKTYHFALRTLKDEQSFFRYKRPERLYNPFDKGFP